MQITLAAVALAWSLPAAAADWPQWRGAGRDGVAVGGAEWPAKLDSESLARVWRVADLGPSYSGPIIAAGKVFTTETVGAKSEVVSAYDRLTGKKLWATQWDGAISVPFFAAKNGSWIRSTPAYAAGKLYVAGVRDLLVCLDAESGKELWRYDFPQELATPAPSFGTVCSPLADETGVYAQAGASLVKLDRQTGKLLWRTLKDAGGMNGGAFASPVLAKVAGRDQLVVQTREKLAGVNPADGEVLWERPVAAFRGMNILTPQPYGPDGVFTSTYGGTSQLLRVTSGDGKLAAAPAWSVKYEGHMTSPVVVAGHAYLLGRDQRLACFDLKAGVETWRSEKRFGQYWSLVAKGDKLLALDDRGSLFLVRANPKEYEPLGECKVSDTSAWAHLAVADDDVVVRDLNALTLHRWAAPK